MKPEEIQIRDPFILRVDGEACYYLFGTTDKDAWKGPGTGFDCYRSRDIKEWDGPFPAFRPPKDFWASTNFWAPEVHIFEGRFYMFASFKAEGRYRATQILSSDSPGGPYVPLTDGPVTPPDWQCLDGTLHVDETGKPWIVFCHEWVQVHNGAIFAMPLTGDLKRAAGRPVFLFNASEAPWARPLVRENRQFPCWVTDGPFLRRTDGGSLLLLWSSLGEQGYTMGTARSLSGGVTGLWVQDKEPIWRKDGGHGMIFRSFEGQLYMTIHHPNRSPDERPFFIPIIEKDDRLLVL